MMAVSPQLQGRGLGSTLLSSLFALHQLSFSKGQNRIKLSTQEERNVIFYERAGFKVESALTVDVVGVEPFFSWTMIKDIE